MATYKQPLPEDWWDAEDRERRQAEIRALNHRLPGIHVVRDEGALQAYELGLDAQERRVLLNELQPPRWKKLALWCACILLCALAWAGIIWGVLALGDWIAGRF